MNCARCGTPHPAGFQFCGACGSPLGAVCPYCGFANPLGFRFCGQCGGRMERACPHCGFDNPPGFRFCGGCGNALEWACLQCGFVSPPDFRFCGGCGQALGVAAPPLVPRRRAPAPVVRPPRAAPPAPPAPPPPAVAPAPPAIPRKVARREVRAPAPAAAPPLPPAEAPAAPAAAPPPPPAAPPAPPVETPATAAAPPSAPPVEAPAAPVAAPPPTAAPPLEGERRLVSVLFADVSGSTAMASKLDPEEATAIMNECFQLLSTKIVQQGGTIDKYIGDAIMALFGAPAAHENDPERAVRAAIGMQEALARFSERLMRRIGLPLRMRIGINTGEVIAGGVGSDAKMDYTVMGDTVNVASRLEHHAEIGKILVSQSTYEATEAIFDYQAMEPLTVKGKDEPLLTYQVVSIRRVRGRIRGIEGLEAKLVGRDEELGILKDSFERAVRGEPQLVGIIGEAGLGKSRLLYEFRKYLEAEGHLTTLTFLKGRSLPYDEANTYGPVLEILRQYFGIEDEDTEERLRRKVELNVPDPDLAPFIIRLLWPRYQDERLRYLSPEQLKRQSLAAIYEVLRSEAAYRPLLVIFEDAHWIDSSSLEALNYLVDRLEGMRILLLCPFRPDFEVPALWQKQPGYRPITLQALTQDQGRELIDSLLKATDIPDDSKELIVQKSGGNPFYVEEIIKSFIDSQVIVRQNGLWHLTRPVTEMEVPGSVQRVIMARIDRLEGGTKRALQQAAVIGRRFLRRILEEITDVDPLQPRLEELEDKEFVFPADLAGEGAEYTFKHILSQEVAYNTLLLRRRREIHRKVGYCVENLYAHTLDQRVETLAYHFFQGEVWDKALVYTEKSGDRTKALYANKEALRYYDQALSLAQRLAKFWEDYEATPEEERGAAAPPSLERPELLALRTRVLLNRGVVNAILAQYDQALQDYSTVVEIAPDLHTAADALWRGGEVHERKGLYDGALNFYQRALEHLPEGEDAVTLRAKVLASLGFVYQRQGQPDRAKECGLKSLGLLKGSEKYNELGQTYNLLGFIYYSASDWEKAIEYWQRSAEQYEKMRDAWQASRIYNNLAVAYFQTGEVDTAVDYFHKNLAAMQKIGDVLTLASAHLNLGNIYLAKGDMQKAVEYFGQSLAMQEKAGQLSGQVRCHISLGELYRKLGDLRRSLHHLEAGLKIATEIGAKESLPQNYRQLAETHLQLEHTTEALDYAQRALELAQQVGKRLEEALAQRALAQALRRLGQAAESEARLRDSAAILTDLGSEHELGLTLCELACLLAEENRTQEAGQHLEHAIALFSKVRATCDLERAAKLQEELKQRQAKA